jgi:hypothetical protein
MSMELLGLKRGWEKGMRGGSGSYYGYSEQCALCSCRCSPMPCMTGRRDSAPALAFMRPLTTTPRGAGRRLELDRPSLWVLTYCSTSWTIGDDRLALCNSQHRRQQAFGRASLGALFTAADLSTVLFGHE